MGTSSLQSPQSPYNAVYRDGRNERIAYPLGGLGAGMIALEGTGGFSHVSLRHTPDVAHEPLMFAAVCIKGTEGATTARVLESQVPRWKVLGKTAPGFGGASNGHSGKHYGLPRFAASAFTARFPFGTVALSDSQLPITAAITGWSPLIPLQLDDSSLPAAALEYTFTNVSNEPVELVFSFHAANFKSAGAKSHSTLPIEGGFVLHQP
ncbi:MAG: hypothetical protein J7639_31365, partial [Paenibacillaceae bacterium]|nr:hypothetical protein [Paenibacillaceae bacterium]